MQELILDSGANSISGFNPDSVIGANCDSQVNSDAGATPSSTPESESIPASKSAPELVTNAESESGRSDSELPSLQQTIIKYECIVAFS